MIHDISPLIDESIAVWPGDTRFESRDVLRIERGHTVHLSTITLSCHTGAHADAPCHFLAGAPAMDEADLERYLGPCVLWDVRPQNGLILPEHLDGCPLEPRLLLRTRDRWDRTVFDEDFAALSPDLVEYVARRGAVLVGVDAPSVDPFSSKDLPAHKALYRNGIANLECLALAGVPAGRYELIALPLRLKGRDASPVRAVLRSL